MVVESMAISGGARHRGALKRCQAAEEQRGDRRRQPKMVAQWQFHNWQTFLRLYNRSPARTQTKTKSWAPLELERWKVWASQVVVVLFGRWWWWGNGNTRSRCALATRLARGSRWRRRWRWWRIDGWSRLGAAIRCSMPSLAAQLARVQSVRTRASHVDAHRPASHLASCLIGLAKHRALWLHGWTSAGETANRIRITNPCKKSQNDSMRLYEDIVTTRGREDVSKTKHKREAWRE